jgi:hypothetical protein
MIAHYFTGNGKSFLLIGSARVSECTKKVNVKDKREARSICKANNLKAWNF